MKTSALSRRGQTVMETAILLFVIVFAFVAMQTYTKRAIQGRLRASADQIGSQYDFAATSSDYTSRHVSNETTYTYVNRQAVPSGGPGGPTYDRTVTTSRTETHYDNTYRSGYEEVGQP